MPKPKEITAPKQLIVEGNDTAVFFGVILGDLGISNIQIQDFGGVGELTNFLEAFCSQPSFKTTVTSVGIVRDAEKDARAAFASVCSSLKSIDLPIPGKPLIAAGTTPQVNVLILPDGETEGMLESVILQAIADEPAMVCVEEYLRCIELRMESLPGNITKARLQAFLASRQYPGLQIGNAARKGYLRLDSPAYESLRQFIHSL